MNHLLAYFFVEPYSYNLFINKAQYIGSTEKDPMGNTYDIDVVSPDISYGKLPEPSLYSYVGISSLTVLIQQLDWSKN